MNPEPDFSVHVLLIEDDPGDADLFREMLTKQTPPVFDVEWAGRLRTGIERLAKGGTRVVILDLSLPDSQGLDTFEKVHTQFPDVPIIVLTGFNDDAVALEAVRKGAQDYLVKGQVDGKALSRVMHYAMERHQMQVTLRNLSLLDDLTGLYNRRGFLTLAEHHVKLATRTQMGSLLLMADLDGMKQINDTFGHHEGDLALIKTAEALRATFRTSDIVARIGGDEFAVVVVEAGERSGELLSVRLQERLDVCNAKDHNRFHLSLSLGIVEFDRDTTSLEALMAKADEALYAHKRSKRKP